MFFGHREDGGNGEDMSVSVELKQGKHGSIISDGSKELLEELLEKAGLKGDYQVTAGAQVQGTPHHQGLKNIAIKPGVGPNTIVITAQPGNNATRREFRIDVPAGERDKTMAALTQATQTVETDEMCEGRTVGEIKADIRRKKGELSNFPTFNAQEDALAQRDAEIQQRQRELDADRRKLEADRGALRLEITNLQTRRRALEADIEFLDLELEEANKKLGDQARAKAEAAAESMGLTYDEFVALIGHKS